jgi:hypothetical protein
MKIVGPAPIAIFRHKFRFDLIDTIIRYLYFESVRVFHATHKAALVFYQL